MTAIATAPRFADQAAIRDLYQRMLDSWLDAPAFAECFTPDATYIIASVRASSIRAAPCGM